MRFCGYSSRDLEACTQRRFLRNVPMTEYELFTRWSYGGQWKNMAFRIGWNLQKSIFWLLVMCSNKLYQGLSKKKIEYHCVMFKVTDVCFARLNYTFELTDAINHFNILGWLEIVKYM